MRSFFCFALLVAGGLSSLALAKSPDKSWPWFRGVDRSAVSKETGLLQEWPENGPPLVWEGKGAGRGYASLAIADGKLFTLGDGLSTVDDNDEYLSCFNLQDGQQLWKARTGPAWNQGQSNWQSSRSTPAVDGDRVYVITPHGELVCCATADGKEVWRKDLKKEFDGKKGDGWGYSESPLIDGDRLICTPGGGKNTMVALNKLTGDLIWSAARSGDKGAGHASIVISQVGETKVYVNTTASGAMGVRASDGKLLWTYDDPQATAVIPTSIVRGDLVFVVSGYRSGGALLRQIPADDGVKVEEVYALQSELKNKHGGVVLVGDYLYGDSDDRGRVYCAEFMTGKVKWVGNSKNGKNSAAICAADGRLYVMYANGYAALVKADPQDYMEVGSFKVGEGKRPHWAHPVVFDAKLYLRDQDRILCYDVKAK
jgi:outer membrane protein assembly factor BamB